MCGGRERGEMSSGYRGALKVKPIGPVARSPLTETGTEAREGTRKEGWDTVFGMGTEYADREAE